MEPPLYFETGQFVELTCDIALPADVQPKPGQGFARLRLSGGIQLTPETNVTRVRELFGPPESEGDYGRDKTLVYTRGQVVAEHIYVDKTCLPANLHGCPAYGRIAARLSLAVRRL